MAGSRWQSLTASNLARASDVNADLAWLEGHIVPMLGGSTTTGVYDLGTSTARWNVLWANMGNFTTISAASILCTSVSATTINTGRLILASNAAATPPNLDVVYADTVVKAWVNIAGTSSGAAIRDDYNVSSISRIATGIYEITYATALGASNSSFFGMAGDGQFVRIVNPPSTGTFRIASIGHDGAERDTTYITAGVVGD